MGAQVIENQWGVEDSDRDDKRQVGGRGAGKGHLCSLPDNTYCNHLYFDFNLHTKDAVQLKTYYFVADFSQY